MIDVLFLGVDLQLMNDAEGQRSRQKHQHYSAQGKGEDTTLGLCLSQKNGEQK